MKWGLLVAALVLIGGVGYFVFVANDDNEDGAASIETSQASQQAQQNTDEIPNELATLQTLVEDGGTAECTFAYSDEQINSSGTVYFHNKNMYGDFTTSQTGEADYQANVLSLGDTQYVWQKSTNEGYKINLVSVTGSEAGEEPEDFDRLESFNLNDDYTFDCSTWSVDESLFEVPQDVTFVDQTELLESFSGALEDVLPTE